MNTAAIYARSDDSALAGQIASCVEYTKARDYTVGCTFTDDKGKATSPINRPGFASLVGAVANNEIDVVVVEYLDRLSRNSRDLQLFSELCEEHGVRIETPEFVVPPGLGFFALATVQSARQSQQVRRGQRAAVLKGEIFGRPAFGYAMLPPRPTKRTVEASKAQIVVWAYEQYARGRSAAAIAADLNRKGILTQGGRAWVPADLLRSKTGLLRNQIYTGRYQYGATRREHSPTTGRSISRKRMQHEVTEVFHPELQIVTPELFNLVQTRLVSEGT